MPFWNLIIFAVSFIATALLAPKPKLENARPGKLSDVSFPRSDEGAATPWVRGRAMLRGANTLWYGNFRAVPIRERIRVSLFKKKTITVGHDYYLSLQLGLGIGPMRLKHVWTNEDKIIGSCGDGNGSPIGFSISQSLGGHKEGGEISGGGVFYDGALDQPVDTIVQGFLGADGDLLPAYRGFATIVFGDVRWGEQAQLPRLAFEVESYPDPLGLGAKNRIGDDINPATALYDILSDDWGGLGLPSASQVSFYALGELLYDEGHGISLVAASADRASEYIDEVIRQIDAVVKEDAATGQIEAKAIRQDYVTDELEVFDDDDTLEIVSFSRSMWETTYNEVRVNYTSPDRNFQTATAFAQDMAGIGRAGRVRAVEYAFPGCHSDTLAQSLAQRELKALTTPLIKCRLILNRRASKLEPGSVFLYENEEFGISGLVLRVERADLGTLEDGRVALDCVQDIFSVGELVFTAPAPGAFTPPNIDALEAINRSVRMAPRFIAEQYAAEDLATDGAAGLPLYIAAKPSGTHIEFIASTEGSIEDSGSYDFSEKALLDVEVSIDDEVIVVTGLEVGNPVDLAQGDGIILVGGLEWMQIENVVDNLNDTYSLTVARSKFQTPRADHELGASVLFLNREELPLGDELEPGTHEIKLLTSTGASMLTETEASSDFLTVDEVNDLPTAPVFVTESQEIDGDETTFDIEWKNRDAVGKQTVTQRSDPSETQRAGEYTVAQILYDDGTPSAEHIFTNGDTTGTISPVNGKPFAVQLFGERENVDLSTSRSIEFDRKSFTWGESSGGGGGGGGATAWRVLCRTSGNAGYFALAEIQFRPVANVANSASGGTVVYDADRGGKFVAANAFDNDPETEWGADRDGSLIGIGYVFPSALDVVQVALTARNDSFATQSPTDFDLEKSLDGGVTWQLVQNFSSHGNFSKGETKVFDVTP